MNFGGGKTFCKMLFRLYLADFPTGPMTLKEKSPLNFSHSHANFLSDASLFLPIKTQKLGHKYVFDHYKGLL